MPPFLSLHALAAARGDGLRPEFLDLFKRLAAGANAALSESVQHPAGYAVELEKDESPSEIAASQEGIGRASLPAET